MERPEAYGTFFTWLVTIKLPHYIILGFMQTLLWENCEFLITFNYVT